MLNTVNCANLQIDNQHKLMYDYLYNQLDPTLQSYCKEHNVFPIELLDLIDKNVFHMIPFHYGFKINKNGIVVDLRKQIIVEPTLNKLGYYTVTIIPDYSDISVSAHIHRLLALTFITPHVWDLNKKVQVNHIDGNKLNNSLSNLEWVTQQQNCLHAYMTGLRNDNNNIKLTNVNTGETKVCYSQAEASRVLGINPATLCEKLKRLILNKELYRGYILEYA